MKPNKPETFNNQYLKNNDYDWSQSLLNEKIEKNIHQQKYLQKVIYALLALLILSLIIIIYLIQLPKKQGFIMVLNERGDIEKQIDLQPNLTLNQLAAIEQYQIIDSIQNLLSVSNDKVLQKIKLQKGMNYILPNSNAEKSIKNFLNQDANNPYLIQKKNTVQIYIKSIKKMNGIKDNQNNQNNQSKRYYQIQLEKQVFDFNQNMQNHQNYEIIITCVYAKSKNEQSIYKNPLGIFIENLEINPIIDIAS